VISLSCRHINALQVLLPSDGDRAVAARRIEALPGGIDSNELAGFRQHYGSLNLRVARNGQTDVKWAPPATRKAAEKPF
jgi:hypothetical protein